MESALIRVLMFWMLTTPHEFAHAWVAMKLGDDTPVLEGRVTLNPLAHVDWLGTVFLPLVMSLTGAGFIGPESGRIGRLIAERGPADAEVQQRIRRVFVISRIDLVVLGVVVADMVFKPGSRGL